MKEHVIAAYAVSLVLLASYFGYQRFLPTGAERTMAVAESCCVSGMAGCTGNKNCTYCKHCAKDGKSCGVCKK